MTDETQTVDEPQTINELQKSPPWFLLFVNEFQIHQVEILKAEKEAVAEKKE